MISLYIKDIALLNQFICSYVLLAALHIERHCQEYGDSSDYISSVCLCLALSSNEGIEGFYKGMVPNLVRVIPACCITFLVFENVSRLLLGEYH